jgi:hypothetical protein
VVTPDSIDAYPARGRLTRGRLLRSALGGGAAVAGGVALGRWSDGASQAAPSRATEQKVLRLFLTLERAQEAFYRAALRSGRLHGDLHRYVTTVVGQETHHVALLAKHAGGETLPEMRKDFGKTFSSADKFRVAAIVLEEAAIAAYIGQGANLRRETLKAVAPLVSVEARQVAWIRDLHGANPAPRAADPARAPKAVLADLHAKGLL